MFLHEPQRDHRSLLHDLYRVVASRSVALGRFTLLFIDQRKARLFKSFFVGSVFDQSSHTHIHSQRLCLGSATENSRARPCRVKSPSVQWLRSSRLFSAHMSAADADLEACPRALDSKASWTQRAHNVVCAIFASRRHNSTCGIPAVRRHLLSTPPCTHCSYPSRSSTARSETRARLSLSHDRAPNTASFVSTACAHSPLPCYACRLLGTPWTHVETNPTASHRHRTQRDEFDDHAHECVPVPRQASSPIRCSRATQRLGVNRDHSVRCTSACRRRMHPSSRVPMRSEWRRRCTQQRRRHCAQAVACLGTTSQAERAPRFCHLLFASADFFISPSSPP